MTTGWSVLYIQTKWCICTKWPILESKVKVFSPILLSKQIYLSNACSWRNYIKAYLEHVPIRKYVLKLAKSNELKAVTKMFQYKSDNSILER